MATKGGSPAPAGTTQPKSPEKKGVTIDTNVETKTIESIDDGGENQKRTLSSKMRAVLLQRNFSRITLFVSDWKLRSYVVPDPDELTITLRELTEFNMSVYFLMIVSSRKDIPFKTFLMFPLTQEWPSFDPADGDILQHQRRPLPRPLPETLLCGRRS